MAAPRTGQVRITPSSDHPGWLVFDTNLPDAFHMGVFGPVLLRQEGERICRMRAETAALHGNLFNGLHGGAIMGLIDTSFFGALRVLTGDLGALGTTIDTSTQFIGAGKIGEPVDAVVELLRETRRLVFLRGTVEQGGELLAAFSGTVRKVSTP